MNEHSSVFASDCESQGKWLSADNLETLFTEETVFTRLGFTPLVDWFASRLITQCWKFISPCPETSPNCVGRAVFKPDWSIFPSINLRISSTFTSSLHFREDRPLPREGYLVCSLVWPFLLCRISEKGKMGRSIAQVLFLVQVRGKEAIFCLKFYDLRI